MRSKAVFGVRIDNDVLAQARGCAQALGLSYSEMVEDAIKLFVKTKKAETGKRFKKIEARNYVKKAA